jgi:putative membrane protein
MAIPTPYCGPPPGPADLWTQWNADPWLLLGLGAAAWLWRQRLRHAAPGAQRSFGAALVVLAVAFVSPLCAASSALFSARVVHHVLMVAVAAPLLALAWPARRTAAPAIGLPLLLATGALYLWHAPPLYDLALADDGVYWLMQLSLLGSATLFWRAVLAPQAAPALAVLAIVASAALMGLLGALLSFAPEPLYLAHRIAPLAFGLSALEDQRLGCLIMWVPALLPYAALAAFTARRWLALPAQARA